MVPPHGFAPRFSAYRADALLLSYGGCESGWRVSRQTVGEAFRLLSVGAGRDARARTWSETGQPLGIKRVAEAGFEPAVRGV